MSYSGLGVIAYKIGCTSVVCGRNNAKNRVMQITLLYVDSVVLNILTKDAVGYCAVQVGSGSIKKNALSAAMRGYFAKMGVDPKAKLIEFRVDDIDQISEKVGDKLHVNRFFAGQYVDVSANSIGKGFAGVMKRHHFRGLRASHGVSVSHRSHGSTGQRQDPGKVFKGKKMAGHLGNKKVTVQNLEILMIDEDKSILGVKGSVPGYKGCCVIVRNALKRINNNKGG